MVCNELHALIEAAGGRTLALFTSWAAMKSSAEALRSRVAYPIFVQGGAYEDSAHVFLPGRARSLSVRGR